MNSNPRTHDRLVTVLLSLPALGYLGIIIADVRRLGSLPFSHVDVIFLAAVIAYLLLVAGVTKSAHRGRLCLMVYATAIPILCYEALGLATRPQDLPWAPQKHRFRLTAKDLPGMGGEVRFTTNWRGVRSPGIWPERREDRVLCVGGSTTECLYVTDEETWPWRLGEKLSAAAGRPVLVANAGRSGQYTGHHLHQLQHYRYANDYGTVIVLCGMNDMAALRRRNLAQVRQRVPEEALMITAKRFSALRGSTLVSTLYGVWKSSTVNPRYAVLQDFGAEWVADARQKRRRYLKVNAIDETPEGLPASLEDYRSNIIRIAKLCRQRGQRVIFVSQPTIYHDDMSEDMQLLLYEHIEGAAHSVRLLTRLMAAYNRRLLETCEELGVECLDLNAMLPKDTTVFYDDCHFNPSGCRKVADAVFEFLQP